MYFMKNIAHNHNVTTGPSISSRLTVLHPVIRTSVINKSIKALFSTYLESVSSVSRNKSEN